MLREYLSVLVLLLSQVYDQLLPDSRKNVTLSVTFCLRITQMSYT